MKRPAPFNVCVRYRAYPTGAERIRFCALGVVAGFLSLSAATGLVTCSVDFTGTEVPQGWTVENGEYRSPKYPNAVDRIRLEYSGGGSAMVYAMPQVGAESCVATLSAASSAVTFDFPATTDFRSFRIAASEGWSLDAFSAVLSATSIDVPVGVVISNNVTGTSFDASWNAVEGATGYRVYVWTNDVASASAGTVVWQETFANAPATASTSTTFRDSYTDSGDSGWHAETVYAYSQEGTVRIGNTKNKGVLVSPALPAFPEGSLTLRITAWRQTTSEGTDMPIGIVSGGMTNIVGVVALGDEATPYRVTLSALNVGDRIAIFSPTNKASARVIVDDVAIVSGYSAGLPLYIVNGLDAGAATEYSFAGLPSVSVQFAVEAYGRRGVTSAKTEAVEVDLLNPEVDKLNACPLSSLADIANTYVQNFDFLAVITMTTGDKKWLNGTTLPYWQAYKGAAAATSIKYNGGAMTSGGLYALSTNQNHVVRALGAYSTKDDQYSFGLSFTNDTDRVITLSSVAYSAQQWGFANTTNQTLSVAVMVTNGLNWISSYAEGWTELGATQSLVYSAEDVHGTPVSTPVDIVPAEEISVAPGQVLMIKWTIRSLKSGKAGMMGIDDVSLKFTQQPLMRRTVIRIVDNAH